MENSAIMNIKSKIKRLRIIVILLVAVLVPAALSAQLQVTPASSLAGWTPDSLVRNVMLGQGVEISNVTFNGSASVISCNGVGKFTTGNTPTGLGMTDGLILSASSVQYVPSSSSGASSTHNCGGYQDADLVNTVHSWGNSFSVNNQCVLEFDFVPKSDTIKFRYVFASEEYNSYECTQYNDIFAFFLDGPSPFGGNYTHKNIALVPGTDTAITISTINGGVSHGSEQPCCTNFTQYYNSNTTGLNSSIDGMTVVLTAQAVVMPCRTYHLKMAVANVSDQQLPSCVFIEANSLSSNGISFEFENAANPQDPSSLYEGCSAIIHMTRPEATPTPTPITVTFDGTANNGLDFEQKNVGFQAFMFPADTTRFDYTIMPFMDGEAEGIETALFTFNTYELCPSDSVEFSIIDVEPMHCEIMRDTLTSATQSVWLKADVSGGMPNRIIRWYNLENGQLRTGDSILVSTITDTRWRLFVEDSCHNNHSDTMLIGMRHHFAFQCPDTTVCADEPVDLFVRGTSAVPVDSCIWYIGNQPPFELENDTVRVNPQETTVYYVRSYTHWNGQIWEDFDSIRILVIPLPETHVVASSERICEGESTTFTASGAFKYSWDYGETFVETSTHTYMPDTTTMITVYGLANGAECYGKDSILIVVDTIPTVVIGDGGGVCGGEEAELTVTTDAQSFAWSASPADPSLGGQENRSTIIVNPSSTTVYTVLATNGVCVTSESTTVAVEPMPIAIGEVTPRTVSLGEMEAVFIDNSQHSTTRRWEFPDGVVSTDREASYLVPDDVDSINVLLWAYNPYQCFDTTTVTVYVDHTTLWVPNAFTPDESTNNTFLVKMNDVQKYHIFIYDRHGVLVFESYDPEKPWDGTGQNGQKCPQGVYTYLISCHKITHPFDQIVRKGTVVLIR